jgi:DNA-directed RNA polymerase beta' subunit
MYSVVDTRDFSDTSNTKSKKTSPSKDETIDKTINITEDMILPDGEITEFTSVAFSILSSEEIRRLSVVEVKESKLAGEGTIYDHRFGVITNHTICVTCKKTNQECSGHSGHIELPFPIPHPMYPEEILMYLNNFCSECSSLLVDKDVMKLKKMYTYKGQNRVKHISSFCEKVKTCPRSECEEDKLTYYVNENKYYKYLKTKTDKVYVSSNEIENILGNIKEDDVRRLGLNPKEIQPINLIISALLVLPICARPFVETSRGPCDDDLTSKYIDIVKVCNKLRIKTMKESDRKEAIDNLEFHIRTLMYNYKQKARQINGRPIKCIRERMNGKDGLFRNNLSGKRGDFTARTVIGPDPRLRADQIAIPIEFCSKLTFPERVNEICINKLEEMVNNEKANFVKRDGKTYDLKFNLKTRSTYESEGFVLQKGDMVLREGKKMCPQKVKSITGRDIVLVSTDKVARDGKIIKNIKISERINFEIEKSDKILRDGKYIYPEKIISKGGFLKLKDGDRFWRGKIELRNVLLSKKRYFKLKIGDIVERHLKDGDLVLFGRQPTLHKGSMIARKVKIIQNTSGINGNRPIRTIRMNLAQNKTYNADFDGDEMNLYVPQSYEAMAELQFLSSTEALLKSGQSSRLLLCITQDALTAGYIFTAGDYIKKNNKRVFVDKVKIDKDTWCDAVSSVDEWDIEYISQKMTHIRDVLKWKGKTESEIEEFIYSGHGLISMLFPEDFNFRYNTTNVNIVRGVMLSGVLGKPTLGDGHSSIVHKLEKEYGSKATVDFVSYYQFLVNHCLRCRGFSIGIEDCIPTRVKDVKDEITKSFMEAQNIEKSEPDEELRERKINTVLNNATSVGQMISKDELQFDNSLNVMVVAGSKGSYVNIAQIRSLLGQQNVEGKRIPFTFGGRTLPHYTTYDGTLPENISLKSEDEERRLVYESRGFVTHCFMEGLTPQEFFFHAEGGREGVIDTAIKTAQSGYIQRKLVKKMEDLVKSYSDGLVVNSKNMVVQFNYQDNFDPAKLVRIGEKMSFVDIKSQSEKLNNEFEWNEWKKK